MNYRRIISHTSIAFFLLPLVLALFLTACNPTKHLKENEYLLRSNTIKLKSNQSIIRKGDLKDNLEHIIVQKPNSYAFGLWPMKVALYNLRYKKYESDAENFQIKSKTVEKPVVWDSILQRRSVQNLKSYMVNQGYFYAKVKDTVVFNDKKKAYVTYNIETGPRYFIDRVFVDADDSTISGIINLSLKETILSHEKAFSMDLLESERSRIGTLMKNKGYFKFSQESIAFQLDTLNKTDFQNAENLFENAAQNIKDVNNRKLMLNVKIIIRGEDISEYRKYMVNRVTIYPDYQEGFNRRDTTLIVKTTGGMTLRYRNYWLRSRVIARHVYLEPGKYYSQNDYDETINKLGELGVFSNINVNLRPDTTDKLNVSIRLARNQKYDFSTTYELSTGTTYALGNALSIGYRNKNLGKGANMFNFAVNGGLEAVYLENKANNVIDRFTLLTRYYGFNTSINFPKFLVPFSVKSSRRNLPRTIIGIGVNFLDRVDYFRMVNTTSSLIYNWRETQQKVWDISPAFVTVVRLPSIADSFQKRLDANTYLKNTYSPTFIEGENVAFTYSNQEINKGRSYSYLRLAAEEAGALMSAVNGIGTAFDKAFNIKFSQYGKFDIDGRHYFKRRHSTVALRLYAGIGIPYGRSDILPYIKQYYVGGAYSIRGWRIRTLGPGSFKDTSEAVQKGTTIIDRTGDLKLEMNAEYRFDIVSLFSGAIKINGAAFADAGNIWLTQKHSGYPNGEFAFNRVGNDLAIAPGAGLRMDIAGFFILRFDLAFPVKKPGYADGTGGWVFDEINFGNRSWRADNLVLNFAIGYPF